MNTNNQQDFEKWVRQMERKTKIEEAKLAVVEACGNVCEFVKANPWIVPVVTSGMVLARKAISQKADTDHKSRYIYDRSLGTYYKLKRPLKPNEMITVDRRKKSGESLGEILREMKVI